jgi:hypothetical protein
MFGQGLSLCGKKIVDYIEMTANRNTTCNIYNMFIILLRLIVIISLVSSQWLLNQVISILFLTPI